MSSSCIHGFPVEQCASCRPCPHGLLAGRCGRCVASTKTSARRGAAVAGRPNPAEKHLGYEIYYEPAVSGWQYRDADANPSSVSYRSAFLARKAVDEVATPVVAKGSRPPADNGS